MFRSTNNILLTCVAISAVAAVLSYDSHAQASNWGFEQRRHSIQIGPMNRTDDFSYTEQYSGTVVFKDGKRLNFNLMETNMLMKGDKAVFRVELKSADGKVLNEEKSTCKRITTASNRFYLSCGNGMLYESGGLYRIKFKGKKLDIVGVIRPLRKRFVPGRGRVDARDSKGKYIFELLVPRGEALFKIDGEKSSGFAYIDHSASNVLWNEISRHWIRTTYITQRESLIFAIYWRKDGSYSGWVYYFDQLGRELASTIDSATFSNHYNDPDKDGYFAPKSIRLRVGSIAIDLRHMKLVRKKDMLASFGSVLAFIIRRFYDPMEYLMKGDALIYDSRTKETWNELKAVDVMIKQLER